MAIQAFCEEEQDSWRQDHCHVFGGGNIVSTLPFHAFASLRHRWFCLIISQVLTLNSNIPTNPQYGAAKYGLVGLTRSAASVFIKENITINAICPAFIKTNLAPKHVLDKFPKEHETPMSTALKAIDQFIDNDKMTGEAVELSLENLYFRKQPEYSNESQAWLNGDDNEFWNEAYKDNIT